MGSIHDPIRQLVWWHSRACAGCLMLPTGASLTMQPSISGEFRVMVSMPTSFFQTRRLAVCAISLVILSSCDRPKLKESPTGDDPRDLPAHIFAVDPAGGPLNPGHEILQVVEDKSKLSIPCQA